jgi:general secretion pathway protein N
MSPLVMTPRRSSQPAGMARRWIVASALLGLLWVLLTQWPAQWLAMMVGPWTQQRVLLLEPRGTLWEGSAYVAFSPGPAGGAPMAWSQRLRWHIRPQGLTGVQISLHPEGAQPNQNWTSQLRWLPSGWQVEVGNLDWQMPTAWLTGLGAPWNTLEPQGQLRIESQNLSWKWVQGRPVPEGQFRLTLLDFSTRLSSLRPLGDYQLIIQANSPEPTLELKTLQGALQMTGQGNWRTDGLQFTGEAWAGDARDETVLSNLLSVLGTRQGSRAILKVG